MIYFVGAGPGAVDLITVRGQKLLEEADLIIYAGSLVNSQLLQFAKEGCHICNSASMTLEDVLREIEQAEKKGWMTVRLHTGRPLPVWCYPRADGRLGPAAYCLYVCARR